MSTIPSATTTMTQESFVNIRVTSAIGIFAALVASPALAGTGMSDQEIASKLLGSWTIPADSSDYDPSLGTLIEIFKRDGTDTLYRIQGGNCSSWTHLGDARWEVRN